jgi:hypothetical protein
VERLELRPKEIFLWIAEAVEEREWGEWRVEGGVIEDHRANWGYSHAAGDEDEFGGRVDVALTEAPEGTFDGESVVDGKVGNVFGHFSVGLKTDDKF